MVRGGSSSPPATARFGAPSPTRDPASHRSTSLNRTYRRHSRWAAGASGWRTSCATRSPWLPVRSVRRSAYAWLYLDMPDPVREIDARIDAWVSGYRLTHEALPRRLHWASARTTSWRDRLPLRP